MTEKDEKTALIKHKALLSLSKNGFTESIKLQKLKKEVICSIVDWIVHFLYDVGKLELYHLFFVCVKEKKSLIRNIYLHIAL